MPRKLPFNLYYVIAFIFLIKFIILAVDHPTYFLMGDSASYLTTALTRWAPADRSYTYGLWIRVLTKHINSLPFVVFCQTLLSAASASLVCFILNRVLAITLPISAICGVLCALEPLQLLSERFILAEATSTFLFALLVTLALSYVKRPSAWLLFAIPLVSVYLVSLRLSFLPTILSTILLPFFYVPDALRNKTFDKKATLRITWHVLTLALLMTLSLHKYEVWYGKAADVPPTLNGSDGFFLISDVAPILRASDFPDPAFGERVLAATKLDLHVLILRTGQHFSPGGLCQTLIRMVDPALTLRGTAQANEIARIAAKNAIRNHPREFAELVRLDILAYFKPKELQPTIEWDEYRDQPLNPGDQRLIAHFGTHVTRQMPPGPVMNWHYHAGLWCMFLIVFPVIPSVFLLVPGLPHKRELLLLTIYTWGQWAICTILVEHDAPRYETALAWLFFPIMGVIASQIAFTRRLGRRGLDVKASVTGAAERG